MALPAQGWLLDTNVIVELARPGGNARVHALCLVTRNVSDVQHSGADVFNPWTDAAI